MPSATLFLDRGKVFYLTLPLLFFILVLDSSVHGQTLDSPEPTNFIRRALNRAIVLGTFVYIEGGEVSQYVDGKSPSDQHPSWVMNSTLSIDISKSWTASTVKIRTIPRKGPDTLNDEAIWIDTTTTTGNSYYVYGGSTNYDNFPEPEEVSKLGIWKFTADGQGGGSWSLEAPANPDTFTSLRYTTNSAFASSAGIGFSIGGYQGANTDPNIPGPIGGGYWGTSGMVSYNMMTKEWQNHTSIGMLGPEQSLGDGRAIHVPGFGPGGGGGGGGAQLVFVLGGSATTDPTFFAKSPLVSFANVSFFDPVSKEWYWQTTTGDVPRGRVGHCLVGALSQEGSFEIFVYGGATGQSSDGTSNSIDDLYVLSLPGFQWFRADDRSDAPRARGACVVVGKRQMLAVGGVDISTGFPKYFQDQDPFPQGLGLFDMTAMKWVRNGSYDADAEAYQSPRVVQDWYRAGNLKAVQWSSNQVRDMFSSANVTFATDNKPIPSKTNRTGLIAGCVVAGCVAVAISVAVFLLYRRRRRTKETKPSSSSPSQQNEGGSVHKEDPKELPVQPPAVEAYVPPVELSQGNHYWELPQGEQHTVVETKTPRAELSA